MQWEVIRWKTSPLLTSSAAAADVIGRSLKIIIFSIDTAPIKSSTISISSPIDCTARIDTARHCLLKRHFSPVVHKVIRLGPYELCYCLWAKLQCYLRLYSQRLSFIFTHRIVFSRSRYDIIPVLFDCLNSLYYCNFARYRHTTHSFSEATHSAIFSS